MALAPGSRLGPYEVIAQIGVGGMGEVYRAIDTNLKRDVAIKVLPEAVRGRSRSAGPLSARSRSARLAEPSQHRAIYGLEKSDGIDGAGDGTGRRPDARRPHRARADPDRRSAADRASRSPRRSKPRTSRGSSIAISSPPTSRSRLTAR